MVTQRRPPQELIHRALSWHEQGRRGRGSVQLYTRCSCTMLFMQGCIVHANIRIVYTSIDLYLHGRSILRILSILRPKTLIRIRIRTQRSIRILGEGLQNRVATRCVRLYALVAVRAAGRLPCVGPTRVYGPFGFRSGYTGIVWQNGE